MKSRATSPPQNAAGGRESAGNRIRPIYETLRSSRRAGGGEVTGVRCRSPSHHQHRDRTPPTPSAWRGSASATGLDPAVARLARPRDSRRRAHWDHHLGDRIAGSRRARARRSPCRDRTSGRCAGFSSGPARVRWSAWWLSTSARSYGAASAPCVRAASSSQVLRTALLGSGVGDGGRSFDLHPVAEGALARRVEVSPVALASGGRGPEWRAPNARA
jgi:hypothetical protein